MEKLTSVNGGSAPADSITKAKEKPKIFEQVWKGLFLLASILVAMLSNKIYQFHSMEEFKDFKKGNIPNFLKYSFIFTCIYLAIDFSIHFLFDDWVEKKLLRRDKYIEMAARKIKSRMIVKLGFNIVYYSILSITGYLLIKDTSFIPPLLGGKGSPYTLVDHRYLDEATFGMEIFYMVQFGKHVGRWFGHCFIKPDGSYFEYLLHHSLASFLIFFSYAVDMWVPGILVLVLHDSSDGFLAISRAYRECERRIEWVLIATYILTLAGWIGLRVIVFSYCCLFSLWYELFYHAQRLTQIELYVFELPYKFMAGMLTCLQVMHLFWLYYIIESFIATNMSKKVKRHSYD